jgi:predicted peptidase
MKIENPDTRSRNAKLVVGILMCIYPIIFPMQSQMIYGQDLADYNKALLRQGGDSLPYRILFPEDYQVGERLPVFIFLHGSGERGNDNIKQLIHGGQQFASDSTIRKTRTVVVFPQCPDEGYWASVIRGFDSTGTRTYDFRPFESPTPSMAMVMNLIDSLGQEPWADTTRFYIGGLSMGAMGTYELLHRKPGRFAAAFAICGGADVSIANSFATDVPLWIFHGTDDPVVSASFSVIMAETIRKSGGKPKLTLYEGVGHDAWTPAFAEPGLLPWLLEHKRP